VPGPASPGLGKVNDVPHGEVHHTSIGPRWPETTATSTSYTPPGYIRRKGNLSRAVSFARIQPTTRAAWDLSVGQGNVILDNLIAAGKSKTDDCGNVMPLGYGHHGNGCSTAGECGDNAELRNRNFTRFREALLTEVIPRVGKGIPRHSKAGG